MKIKQEHFDKLSQLDRIEFMLRLKRIEDNGYGVLYPFMKLMFIAMGFLFLVGINFYSINETIFISIFSLLSMVAKITVGAMIILTTLDMFSYYLSHKKIKELTNKFFKFKVEVKKQ